MTEDAKIETEDASVLYPGPDDTVVVLFYQGWGDGNFMATVWCTATTVQGSWRWRYYRDEKVEQSDDVRNWYTIKGQPGTDPSDIVKALDAVAELHRMRYGEGLTHDEKIEVNGPSSKLMELLADRPWAHLRMVEKQ